MKMEFGSSTNELTATGVGVPTDLLADVRAETRDVHMAAESHRKAPRGPHESTPLSRAAGLALVAVATLALAWWSWKWWSHHSAWVKTDNAYTSAHVHHVSARVAGTIAKVLVEENQEVAAGALITRLDPRDYEVRLDQAKAEAAQARAKREQASAAVVEAESKEAKARVHVGKTGSDLNRATSLFQDASGAISRQEYDDARAASDAAEAALKEAKAGVRSAQAALGAAQASQQAAAANLRQAELDLSYTEVRAPAAGRIGKKNLETGNRVLPGQALVALVEPEVWLTANYKETQVGKLQPGQSARMRFDAFPGKVFEGFVLCLSPASGAQFALLPPDNATGNFTRVVQRVPVKITLVPGTTKGWEGRIVPGMSAVVEVKVR
jgi:membrane fusion protein (multidrug efflux system)